MRKILILVFFLLILVGCKDETVSFTPVPTTPTVSETAPNEETKPIITKPTESVNPTFKDLIPNTEVKVSVNNLNQSYYAWVEENKLYLSGGTVNQINVFLSLDKLLQSIDVSSSIGMIGSINSFIKLIEDVIYSIKVDNNIDDNAEYVFDGEAILQYVEELPLEMVPEDVLDVIKEICLQTAVKVKFTEGKLTKAEAIYGTNIMKFDIQYHNNKLSNLKVDIDIKVPKKSAEEELIYHVDIKAILVIDNDSLTFNLDGALAILSNYSDNNKTYECAVTLTATNELITINFQALGYELSGKIIVGDNLKANLVLIVPKENSSTAYQITVNTGVEVPERILANATKAEDFTAKLQLNIDYYKNLLDIRNWL